LAVVGASVVIVAGNGIAADVVVAWVGMHYFGELLAGQVYYR